MKCDIHVDLFSGIGGFALAAHWAGLETVLFCEKEPYAQKVLQRHWPHVPIVDDIRELDYERYIRLLADSDERNGRQQGPRKSRRETAAGEGETRSDIRITTRRKSEARDERFLENTDIRRFSKPEIRTKQQGGAKTVSTGKTHPFLLTGGFPCQPFSHAGKRGGTEDDRYLWPEMVRVIEELRPTWVLGENVAGILSMDGVFDEILTDLGGIGYDTATFVIPAAAVGAPHRRDRVWIVGYDGSQRELQSEGSEPDERGRDSNAGESADVGHAERSREDTQSETGRSRRTVSESDWRQPEPRLGREFNGLPPAMDRHRWPAPLGLQQYEWEPPRVTTREDNRANRLKALGNAIVPQVAYEIIRSIQETRQAR